ncbi:Protein bark beetle [Amphibalanus amphitrite]|uniref:Protein bark beetle n=1 Tax=Amphibalanus amphitrite TaxID=1232801 RepID=A0A6A4W426_AMPAM|nr:Protein bark beetle [Amphibalanus amphitrite]
MCSSRVERPTPTPQARAWGGVRFSTPTFEVQSFFERLHDVHTHGRGRSRQSRLRFVDVLGAGWLHGEKSPALLSVAISPDVRAVNVTGSLSDGVTVVNPTRTLDFMHLWVHNNLGIGLNTIMLTGEARSSGRSSFVPLQEVPVPYNLFGMVDMCDAHKEIVVQERILLYYKYDNRPVDCVKIFTSSARIKTFGFRLLQFNLVNSTDEPLLTPDYIRLYDGDIYNVTSRQMAQLSVGSSDGAVFHVTNETSMSVQLHASGAGSRHGFIAEVVTLPVSSIGFSRYVRHNVSYSDVSSNEGGGISYMNAGEINPTLTLEWNRLMDNGRRLYGNFTSSRAAVLLDVQNTQHLYFTNNIIQRNQGGLHIRADSNGLATALKAYIYLNLFADNLSWSTLYVEGRKTSPYQEAILYYNYFTRANCTFQNVLEFNQVVANFSYNLVHNNRGFHIMKVSGNYATDREERTTVLAGSAGQQYADNVLVNIDNDYELVTINRTEEDLKISNYRYEVWRTPLDARHNWWGYNETLAIQGRIKDKLDGQGLLRVDFSNFHMNNRSLLSGKCPPGWTLVDTTCFMYMPAPMNFTEAKQFCLDDNASMPYLNTDYSGLVRYIRGRQERYNWRLDRVWVQHLDIVEGCSYFVQQRVVTGPCELQLPFLCEMDPRVTADPLSWTRDDVVIGVLGAGAAALLFLLVICGLWVAKSRHRHREKLHRRNSIRSSVRSTRSLASSFSDVSGGTGGYRRRPNPNPMPDGATGGSVDSIAKPSFDETHSTTTFDERFAHDPRLENANADALARPTFDLGYENRGYLDRSTFTSRVPSPWEPAGAGAAVDSYDQKMAVELDDCKPSSVADDSGASDSTLELKRPFGDEDAASDTVPVYEGCAGTRSNPASSDGSALGGPVPSLSQSGVR